MFETDIAHDVQHHAPQLHVPSSRFLIERANVPAMELDLQNETPGKRLRRLREAAGLTLEQIAECLDTFSPSRITHYEKDRREMSRSVAVRIANRLSVTAAYLLCLDNDQPILSEREQQLVRYLRALPQDLQDEFHRRIAALGVIHAPVAADMFGEVVAKAQRVSRAYIEDKKKGASRVEPRRKSKARNAGRT